MSLVFYKTGRETIPLWLEQGAVVSQSNPFEHALVSEQLQDKLMKLTKPQLLDILDKHGLTITNKSAPKNDLVKTFVRRWDLINGVVSKGVGKGNQINEPEDEPDETFTSNASSSNTFQINTENTVNEIQQGPGETFTSKASSSNTFQNSTENTVNENPTVPDDDDDDEVVVGEPTGGEVSESSGDEVGKGGNAESFEVVFKQSNGNRTTFAAANKYVMFYDMLVAIGIQPDDVRLVYDDKTLDIFLNPFDYSMEDGDTVEMFVRVRGGGVVKVKRDEKLKNSKEHFISRVRNINGKKIELVSEIRKKLSSFAQDADDDIVMTNIKKADLSSLLQLMKTLSSNNNIDIKMKHIAKVCFHSDFEAMEKTKKELEDAKSAIESAVQFRFNKRYLTEAGAYDMSTFTKAFNALIDQKTGGKSANDDDDLKD